MQDLLFNKSLSPAKPGMGRRTEDEESQETCQDLLPIITFAGRQGAFTLIFVLTPAFDSEGWGFVFQKL